MVFFCSPQGTTRKSAHFATLKLHVFHAKGKHQIGNVFLNVVRTSFNASSLGAVNLLSRGGCRLKSVNGVIRHMNSSEVNNDVLMQ